MGILNNLRLAVAFLTIFPVAPRGVAPTGSARAYFPLVGLALGGILAGLDFAARQALPPLVVGALLLIALLILTRALHTEGFLDSCDGLIGGYTPKRRLEILRDSHVGAFAVIGGAALLILKWTLLASIPADVSAGFLIAFPSISRFGMLSTMSAFKYARKQGLGTSFQAGSRWWHIGFALVTAAVAAGLLLGFTGFILLGATIAVALVVGWRISRLLGGMTGDTYGAVNEIGEVMVLLLGIVLYRSIPEIYQSPVWMLSAANV